MVRVNETPQAHLKDKTGMSQEREREIRHI